MPARIEDFILVAGLNGCSTPVEQRPRHRNYSASSRLLYLSRPDMWCRRETLRRRLRRQVPGHKLLNSGVLPSKHPQFRVSLRIMWSKVALQTLDRERDRHPHAVVPRCGVGGAELPRSAKKTRRRWSRDSRTVLSPKPPGRETKVVALQVGSSGNRAGMSWFTCSPCPGSRHHSAP